MGSQCKEERISAYSPLAEFWMSWRKGRDLFFLFFTNAKEQVEFLID